MTYQPTEAEVTEPGAHQHSMLGSFTHSDERTCGWHQRLGQWLILGDPTTGMNVYALAETYACTREHPPLR